MHIYIYIYMIYVYVFAEDEALRRRRLSWCRCDHAMPKMQTLLQRDSLLLHVTTLLSLLSSLISVLSLLCYIMLSLSLSLSLSWSLLLVVFLLVLSLSLSSLLSLVSSSSLLSLGGPHQQRKLELQRQLLGESAEARRGHAVKHGLSQSMLACSMQFKDWRVPR